MKRPLLLTNCLLAAATLLGPAAMPARSQDAPAPKAIRDGQHDFDFNFGTWTTHITRRVHPLSGSDERAQMTGTVTVRKVWGGSAWLEEIVADGGGAHLEGMTLFVYTPASRQWSQSYIDKSGARDAALIGAFSGGRGELYAQDMLDGRAILIRATWSEIAPDSHRFEEAYSDDGGTTWETEFSANLTRKS